MQVLFINNDGGGFADHIEIALHAQQGGQRAAHHRLIFGQNQANHA